MIITKQQAISAQVNGSKSVLTKREQFAGMAMQALIVKMDESLILTCITAVKSADALLEALEESKEAKD
tara:strand:- start:10 stop:216 length:207 start_codon:yes stop_codon:yes gene_type:complete